MLAAACISCKRESAVKSGDEVFAVLDDNVLAVSLRGSADGVVASRATTKDSFRYKFTHGRRKIECETSPKLDAAMRRTLSVRALDVYEGEQLERLAALRPDQKTQLEVKSVGEPAEPFVLTLAAENGVVRGTRVDAYLTEYKAGFAVDARILDLIRLSCESD